MARADRDHPGHALGVLGREQGGPARAGRQADDHGFVGAGRIHHRERVGGELGGRVRLGRVRPVRLAVTAPVERDHAGVAGQVRELHLPHARVHDRPRRQQHDRAVAVAVALPVEADAVALDVAGLVRIGGALHARSRSASQLSVHSISPACPVVMPESRSWMIPMLNVMTSETKRVERHVDRRNARAARPAPR